MTDQYFQNYRETTNSNSFFAGSGVDSYHIVGSTVFFEGYYVWANYTGGSIYIYKTLGYNSSNTLIRTITPSFSMSDLRDTSYFISIIDGTLYFVMYFKFDYRYASNDQVVTTYTNDLDSWSGSNNEGTAIIGTDLLLSWMLGIFKLSSTVYFCFVRSSGTNSTDTDLYFHNFTTLALVTSDTTSSYSTYTEWSIAFPDGDIAYYFTRTAQKTYVIRQFNGTTCSTHDTIISLNDLPIVDERSSIIYPLQTKKLLINGSGGVVFVYSNKDLEWKEEISIITNIFGSFIIEYTPSFKLTGFITGKWIYKVYKDSYAKNIYWGSSGRILTGGLYDWQRSYGTGDCILYIKAPYQEKGRGIVLDISHVEINTTKGTALILDDTFINYWEKGEIVTLYDFEGNKICFEGFVDDYEEDESPTRTVYLKSQWLSDLERKVDHEITSLKTTDEILEELAPLFLAFMGVDVSTGTATYQPNFLQRDFGSILKNYSLREGWSAYVDYENMNFVVNNGLVDSGIDCLFNSGDKIEDCKPIKKPYFVSECFIYGGIDAGKTVVGYARASDPNSGNVMILYEPNEINKTKLDAMAQAVIDKMENEILSITFGIVGKGCIQWGEQIDFEYSPYSDRMSELGSSEKYFLNEVVYYPMIDFIECTISDKLIVESTDEIKDQISSHEELINQNALEITSKPDNVSDLGLTATVSEINNVADLSLGSTAKNSHTHDCPAIPDSSNKKWIPLIMEGWSAGYTTNISVAVEWTNTGGTDYRMAFMCPLPPELPDGRFLHIDQIRYSINDADSTDYITQVYCVGLGETTYVTCLLYNTDHYTPLNDWITKTMTTVFEASVNAVRQFRATISVYSTTANEFGFRIIEARYWYE